MKAPLYNLKNETVGEIELPKVFSEKWRPALVRQVVLAQLANARESWAHAKGRNEVRGGGRKPWRQKGTGRARHGSIRSPLWRGGGKAHGPINERDYSQKVNKKMRRLALLSALSKKMKDSEVKIFDSLVIEASKTKVMASSLRPILGLRPKSKNYNVLLVHDVSNKTIFRAARNLPKAKVLDSRSLNPQDILKYKNIFIEEKAVEDIAAHYATKK